MTSLNPPMVLQIMDKFDEYVSVHKGSSAPSGDKQNLLVLKKGMLKELPNPSDNLTVKSPENSSLIKEKGFSMDSAKAVGSKRQQPDSPSSPLGRQPLLNKGVDCHLVYVRRKLETDRGKKNISSSNNADTNTSPVFAKCADGEAKESKVQQDQTQECHETSHSHEKGTANLEPNGSTETTTATTHVPLDPQKPVINEWKERYIQLQKFLKNCDQSSQEDYKQMLRNLSAADRSRHARELEKRALHLMLEEAKELHRMQVLNIVSHGASQEHTRGEAALREHAQTSSQLSAGQTPYQRTEKNLCNPKSSPFLRNGY